MANVNSSNVNSVNEESTNSKSATSRRLICRQISSNLLGEAFSQNPAATCLYSIHICTYGGDVYS